MTTRWDMTMCRSQPREIPQKINLVKENIYMLLSINLRIAKALGISEQQVESTVHLLDDGATVPFISRYRKEVTGSLTDTQLRDLVENLSYMRELDDRRDSILKSIDEQGKLTPELKGLILATDNKTTLEDLYLPYKPKRRTKAQIARESGLEQLALDILQNQHLDIELEANKYIDTDKNVPDTKTALDGARYILMEIFAENANILSKIRYKLWHEGLLATKIIVGHEIDGAKFTDYFDYSERISVVPSHRALAAFRGANEKILTLNLTYPEQETLTRTDISSYDKILLNEFEINSTHKWLLDTVKLCFKAKIFISIENELLSKLRETADAEAIKVFATNLHNLLLQAPAGTKTTIGLDPGIRTGVKVAVIDNTGKMLEYTTIYPFQPKNDYQNSIHILANLAKKHNAELISIGNGTASRETEAMVTEMLTNHPEIKATKVIVSEAGASVYSASEYAAKEFPDLDVTIRGAVSIGRRLQDPLAEYVKIDPKSIGVGQYQHDVNQAKLSASLINVVEDCVNSVGVDVNTASIPLLTRVSGLNTIIATNIVNYRDQNGKFKNRKQLKKVPRLGEKTFEQCAGFLRIYDGDNKLDESAVHPESYPLIDLISQKIGSNINNLIANSELIRQIKATEFVNDIYGLPTILDTIKELEKPGRDPRGEFKTAKFKDNVHEISDLIVGMELEGVVTNVTNFGAFIDIGVHQDGLVHISEITDKFIENPNEVLKTGQIVKVTVLEVDKNRKRIALSMRSGNRIKSPASKEQDSPIKTKVQAQKHIQKPITPQNAMADAFSKLRR